MNWIDCVWLDRKLSERKRERKREKENLSCLSLSCESWRLRYISHVLGHFLAFSLTFCHFLSHQAAIGWEICVWKNERGQNKKKGILPIFKPDCQGGYYQKKKKKFIFLLNWKRVKFFFFLLTFLKWKNVRKIRTKTKNIIFFY